MCTKVVIEKDGIDLEFCLEEFELSNASQFSSCFGRRRELEPGKLMLEAGDEFVIALCSVCFEQLKLIHSLIALTDCY